MHGLLFWCIFLLFPSPCLRDHNRPGPGMKRKCTIQKKKKYVQAAFKQGHVMSNADACDSTTICPLSTLARLDPDHAAACG